MKFVVCDFETFSEIDLNVRGLDVYAKHPSTGVHMLSWAADDEEVQLWIPINPRSTADMPARLRQAIEDPRVIFIAHHVSFERAIFREVLGIDIPVERWRDVEVCALSYSLPGSLEKIGNILQIPEQYRKADGEELMKLFSYPIKPRKKKGQILPLPTKFNRPEDFPVQWEQFKSYCIQDTVAERYLWKLFQRFSPVTDEEWQNWFLDQHMNLTGMPVNRHMVENALAMALEDKAERIAKLQELTGLANPLSDKQMKGWLETRGYTWGTLLAAFVDMELKNPHSKLAPEAKEVLKLRRQAKKISYTKLERILDVISDDDRVRYQFRFGGAARTGRWSGADVQTQNMPRPNKFVKKNFEKVVALICAKDRTGLEAEIAKWNAEKKDNISLLAVIVSAIRMCFHAPKGQKMVISDLNAIENRGLGYLARCAAILKVFKKKRDPYLALAEKLYKQDYADLLAEYEKGVEEKRQSCKAAVLGSGYGLGAGARKNKDGSYEYIMVRNEFGDMVHTGLVQYAKNMGIELSAKDAFEVTQVFRKSYPEVTQYWKDLEEGFKRCLKTGENVYIGRETYAMVEDEQGRRKRRWVPCDYVVEGAVLEFSYVEVNSKTWFVRIKLPSGRYLHYLNPFIEKETVIGNDGKPWTRDIIYYEGIEHSATTDAEGARTKKSYAWGTVKTYGGKLCENVVQAFCRDLLAYGMRKADELGFVLIGCFHDELAALADNDPWGLGIKNLIWAQVQAPPYSPDMPLGAEGFESPYYRKN